MSPDASPDAQLAERITQRLVADGLIVVADAPAVREGLATGQPSRATWRGWVDAAADAPAPRAVPPTVDPWDA